MKKLNMQTPDLTAGNIAKIAELFPSVITEREGKDGVVEKVVDFDLLRQALQKELVEGDDERYRLDWPGKRASLLKANTPIQKTLRPDRESSVNFDTTQNLFIEGDNFDVLKMLQESYLGKIDMIYIDPPYNTGKDFVYKDNFVATKEDYEEEIGVEDEGGGRLFRNTDTNGRFHSDWLSMMYERLVVARDLLKDDGVLFVSIDDNEASQLKLLCNDIYGESNYLAVLNIQVRYADKSINEEKPFKPLLEQILIYAKNANIYEPNRPEEIYTLDKFVYEVKEIKNGETFRVGENDVTVYKKGEWELLKHDAGNDRLLKETWISGSIYSTMSYGKVFQKVVEPRVGVDGLGCLYKVHGRGDDGLGYRYYTGPAKQDAKRGKMYSGVPHIRVEEMKTAEGSVKKSPIPTFYDYSAEFGNIRHEGGIGFNSGKKPIKLLSQLVGYQKRNDILVLDFFAGSASTAHAVIQHNVEDGGTRRFIMVQIPEETPEESETRKAGFLNIAEIGKERIRRAGKKILEENKEALKERETPLDIGFRVYKADTTNMKDVYYNPADLKQESLLGHVDNVKDDRTSEDLLTQVILDLGLELTLPIEQKKLKGNTVYFVQGNALVACFDEAIDFAIVDEIAKLEPLKVVFRDSSFKEEQDRTNVETRFKRLSPDTVITVL